MGAVRVLLDTHALLFWLFDDDRLSKTARELMTDPQTSVFVSAASAWEIATKHRIGKLDSAHVLVQDIAGWVERTGFEPLPITLAHAHRAGSWPHSHRDPFDRVLAAQAVLEGMPLVSRDEALRAFGPTLLW